MYIRENLLRLLKGRKAEISMHLRRSNRMLFSLHTI